MNKLNASDFAAYRCIWQLPDHLKKKLDKHFLVKCDPDTFFDRFIEDDPLFDEIEVQGIRYQVHYVSPYDPLVVKNARNVLISIRYHERLNIRIALCSFSIHVLQADHTELV